MKSTNLRKTGLGLALLAGTVLSAAGGAGAAEVTYQRILNPEDGNWLTNNRTYNGNRYSPLAEITRENVGGLKLAFALPLIPRMPAGLGGGLHATALVDDGIMYMVDGAGALYRIDVTSGTRGYINWIMDPETDPEIAGIVNNRGAALLGNNAYTVTRDGYLTATDAGTGEVLWEVATQQKPEEYFTMAPLAIDGKIIMGPAGDAPMRGRMEGRSAEDGSLLWTFHTIPGPGEPGHETWPADSDIWQTGASGLWVTGSYDPDLDLLYYGTANPTPFGDATLRPGDNLYSSSLLAIKGATGDLAWYFQYTPNEQWDYDEIGSHQLYEVNGEKRVGHFGRNGFYYTFNAETGLFLSAQQYVKEVTWTAGIDPKTGKPVEYDPSLASGGIQKYAHGALSGEGHVEGQFCPNIQGGVNHFPTSYSPRTGLSYGSSIEGCWEPGEGIGVPGKRTTGAIVAANGDGQIVAKHELAFAPYGGNVSTAGGVTFASDGAGDFFALNDETLERLWGVNLGSPIEGPPVTYAVGGKQYIMVPVATSNLNSLFGGGGYPARGDDPNAASLVNMQRTWTLYFFTL